MQELKRTICRRVGSLVIKITPEGIELRGYRKRADYRRKLVTWEQIASLSDAEGCQQVLVRDEQRIGRIELEQFGADLTAERLLCAAEIWNSGKRAPRLCKLCKSGPCRFGIERKPVEPPKLFDLEGA